MAHSPACLAECIVDEGTVPTPQRREDAVDSGVSDAGTTPDSIPPRAHAGFTPSSDDASPEPANPSRRVATLVATLEAEARSLPTVALRSYTRSFLFDRENPVGTVASDLFALGRSVKNVVAVSGLLLLRSGYVQRCCSRCLRLTELSAVPANCCSVTATTCRSLMDRTIWACGRRWSSLRMR
jgi:hypothetical protein